MDFNNQFDSNEHTDREQPVNPTHTTASPYEDTAPIDETPRTPYQTPVRGSDEVHDQTLHSFDAGSAHPAQTQTNGQPPYTTYEDWKQQQAQKKHGGKKRGRTVALVIGGVAAAVLLFAGGAAVGSLASGQALTSSSQTSAVQSTNTVNENAPTVTISATPQSNQSDSSGVLSGEQIFEKVNPSVVLITANYLRTSGVAYGSGVVMTEDGYIITNAHVINDDDNGEADRLTVTLSDGVEYPATVVGSDTTSDLAVLKIEPTTALQTAEFGDSDALKTGQACYAIGSPSGAALSNSFTGGHISAINRDITIDDRVMTLIQTDASINPGNSGGALINEYGQVVGITNAKLGISYYEGLGFAIPINYAKTIIDELIVNGYVTGRPAVGITGWNLSAQRAAYNNVPQGVVVDSIDANAPAASEGLQPKDIITAVNGQTVTTMDEINAIKENMTAGDKLTLTVYRMSAGKSLDVTITLMDAHDLSSSSSTQSSTESSDGDSSGNYYSNYGYGSYGNYGSSSNPFSSFFGY
jgi:serine protease Do